MKVFLSSTHLDLTEGRKAALLRRFTLIALLIFLLTSCATPTPTITPAPSLTPSATATPTKPAPTETPTPEPTWMMTIKTQDPEGSSFKVVDGKPVIDLYDTQSQESIVLNQETIKIMPTADGLNPNILTGQDVSGNQYAFNPDFGWFQIPDVQMDYNKYREYTELPFRYFGDGTANIITALKYAENPTISPDAIDPVYWVGYSNFKQVLTLCLNACGRGGLAYTKYPEEIQKMYYNADTKPFAWTGYYKTHLENGETIYVISRTLKNPTETNQDQTINLFYGFDQATYEYMANSLLGDNITTELKLVLGGTDRGGYDLVTILAPPEPFPFYPAEAALMGYPNPVVGSLQQRGQLISLFSQDDYKVVMEALEEGQRVKNVSPLSQPLPAELSKYILLNTVMGT